jgi:hypothetical protein
MIRRFHSFLNRVARYITGRHIRQREDGTYDCPPTVEVIADAGLENIDTYNWKWRATIQEHGLDQSMRNAEDRRLCLQIMMCGNYYHKSKNDWSINNH